MLKTLRQRSRVYQTVLTPTLLEDWPDVHAIMSPDEEIPTAGAQLKHVTAVIALIR